MTGPEGADGLVFVVEQAGRSASLKNGRKLGGKPFLDIRKRVAVGRRARPALGRLLPRLRARTGSSTSTSPSDGGDIVVQEYRRASGNPRDAREDSARTVIKVRAQREPEPQRRQRRSSAPTATSTSATGDGGSGGDPPENAQDKDSLLGKLLRIDPRRNGERAYTIPNGNPFAGGDGRQRDLLARPAQPVPLLVRPPQRRPRDRRRRSGRASRRSTTRPSESARGANFGWDAFEGKRRFDSSRRQPAAAPATTTPIFDYSHGGGGCTVIGGYVSRDRRIPLALRPLPLRRPLHRADPQPGPEAQRRRRRPRHRPAAAVGDRHLRRGLPRRPLLRERLARGKVYAIKPKR